MTRLVDSYHVFVHPITGREHWWLSEMMCRWMVNARPGVGGELNSTGSTPADQKDAQDDHGNASESHQ